MTNYEKICLKSKELDAKKQRAVLKFINELYKNDTDTDLSEPSERSPEPEHLKPCPHCHTDNVKKAGFERGKQRFQCKVCGKHYVTTTGTIMENSHYGAKVWETVAADTLEENVSLDKTAEKAGISHNTAFNMRHKILLVLEAKKKKEPTKISGISELDETYVLECEKGKKFDENAPRKPRKHGAVASKRGISDEQICIMTGVQRGGAVYAETVNRAHPSNEEIKLAFKEHIAPGTIAFTDGLKGYKCLETAVDCVIESVPNDKQKTTGTVNLNNVNGFHSHIKDKYKHYRGVATKYLNRYNALFQTVYKNVKATSELVKSVLSFEIGSVAITNLSVQNGGLLIV